MIRKDEENIDVFLHRWLRRILKINWNQHVTNEEVRRQPGVKEQPRETVRRRRRWVFIGNTLGRDSKNLARNTLTWTPKGKRKRGRPQETYIRNIFRER